MLETKIRIGQILINRQKEENLTPLENLFPLPKNLITAENLLYAQNHINYPSFIHILEQRSQTLYYSNKENHKPLLSQTIFIKETFLSIPKHNPLLLRTLPETPIFLNHEHHIENPIKFLEKAEQDFKRPIKEREIYIIEPNGIPTRLSINPFNPLLNWLFLDQSDNFIACAEKHGLKELLFYFPNEKANPFIRGLWITPLNDPRAPPIKEDKITLGAYRYGSEFLYCTT